MRYFEIVKPTTDTISAATDTRDAEALTKQPKSVRPSGAETSYPIPLNGGKPLPQGCQSQTLKGSRASEHADRSQSA